ncbi:MAG: APC family permease [Candidatus Dormibacteraeota bacterium]|nr:APC family permease [Candidatus Dormibacteraeota bacterium]
MSTGEDTLKALGYQQELHRSVSPLGHIALVLSDITPTASILVVATAVIAVAGTGSLLPFILGCFIAVNVALCMGELGSMFPVAGGLFSIVTRVLGRPLGFIAMVDYMGQAVFLPASIAIGIGTYIHSLLPSLPENAISGLGMLVVTGICLLKIRLNAWLTGVFLAIELVVVTAITVAGFTHLHQPLSIAIHPVTLGSHGALVGIAGGAVLAAIATSLFSVNGYDSGINFAEEVLGSAREVGRAVVTAALVGIVFELVPFIAVIFAAPSVEGFLRSGTPFTYVAGAAFGAKFETIITIGALLAIFNASIAITLQFARIVWASGRDRAWPEPISSWFSKVSSRHGSPWVATLFVGVLATVLCFQGTLVAVVTFTAVLLIILYGLIAISALVSRVRQRQLPRPSKMPLWPAPPILALVGVVLALTQQKVSDLITVAVIFGAAVVYYYGFVARRGGRYWVQSELPEPYEITEPLPPPAEA